MIPLSLSLVMMMMKDEEEMTTRDAGEMMMIGVDGMKMRDAADMMKTWRYSRGGEMMTRDVTGMNTPCSGEKLTSEGAGETRMRT